MSNITVDALVEWIKSQPRDRKVVSHHSWADCVVGDYAREVHGHVIPRENYGDGSFVLEALYTSESDKYVTFVKTLPSNRMNIFDWCPGEMNTYGKTLDYYNQCIEEGNYTS